MEFNAHFHQLGAIESATIRVKPLTVIAGENGCGKTFVTKSLYSVLSALNRDHVSTLIAGTLRFVRISVDRFEDVLRVPSTADRGFVETLHEEIIPTLEQLLIKAQEADLQSQRVLVSEISQSLEEMETSISAYRERRQAVKKMEKPLEALDEIEMMIRYTRTTLQDHDKTVVRGIANSLEDNLKKNFQVRDLKSILHNASEGGATIRIEGIGEILIDPDSKPGFELDAKGIDEIQRLENIIFVDSPVYLKIRKGLERRGLTKFARDRYLQGYPQYIDELYHYIDGEYLDTPDLAELSEELQQILEGKLIVGRAGEMDYQNKNGAKVPLALTAMGISNIGLIELLIRNNVIKPGSFLIIDEPEAHLHPKWQVVLMDVLYKIARAGANVIVATHSIDMVKKVEVLLQQDEDAEEFIALNPMPCTGSESDSSEQDKVEQILQQLSAPFYDLYVDNLW